MTHARAALAAAVLLALFPSLHSLRAAERVPAPAGFEYPVADGLFATVTAMDSFEAPKIKGEKVIKLKDLPGFKMSVSVRALLQDKPAPLAVILLGLATQSKDPLARLWQQQAYEAGFHVLAFDSVFRRSFNERSRHGLPGYLEAEALAVAQVVEAFAAHPDVQGRVTKVGLLGASYGGMLALNVMRLAQDGKTKLKPERARIFSSPVSMRTAAALLDRYFDEDRSQFALLQLARLKGQKPTPEGAPVPFEASLMRAGIAYVFREDLEEAILCASEVYDCRMEPQSVGMGPAGKFTDPLGGRVFSRYYEELVVPYWTKQGALKSPADLAAMGDLRQLLPKMPEGVRAFLAVDDPLNDPKELDELKSAAKPGQLLLLPRGGHLGYVGTAWAKAQVQDLFK
ncbi:MAG: hypothetical protein KIS92_02410 [Planctomycetota bacterium]|nr:hypothetical protein [Planctomycetota bacterium]